MQVAVGGWFGSDGGNVKRHNPIGVEARAGGLSDAQGTEVGLLTSGLFKLKGPENRAAGKGYIPTFAGVFTLLRRGRARSGAWTTGRHVG